MLLMFAENWQAVVFHVLTCQHPQCAGWRRLQEEIDACYLPRRREERRDCEESHRLPVAESVGRGR